MGVAVDLARGVEVLAVEELRLAQLVLALGRREHRRPQRDHIIGLAVGEPREMRRKHSTGQFAIRVAGDQRQQLLRQ